MHAVVRAWAVGLALLAALPAHAVPREMTACTGPDDPAPCLLEDAGPDRTRLPASGLGAWAGGNRLVISWVGEADEVEVTGSILLPRPLRKVAPDLHQLVIQYPKAQQTRSQLRFAVTRGGNTTSDLNQVVDLVGPEAFAIPQFSKIEEEPIDFGKGLPRARVWLPPGYKAGVRYPILYLADGGGTSPGPLLTEPMRKGELAPLIVVGVDYAPEGKASSDLRMKTYLGASSGTPRPEFLAHERFLLDTVIPTIEARYGAPPERRLRAVGGASNGGVWSASMALRNPGVFGTAFVMSPGVRPAQHGQARSSVRFYVSAGELEPQFHLGASCLAGDIVARGGIATFTAYPSGHDIFMWARVLVEDTRDWLAPRAAVPVPAALPGAGCGERRQVL